MELFVKTFYDLKPVTIFVKTSVLDIILYRVLSIPVAFLTLFLVAAILIFFRGHPYMFFCLEAAVSRCSTK